MKKLSGSVKMFLMTVVIFTLVFNPFFNRRMFHRYNNYYRCPVCGQLVTETDDPEYTPTRNEDECDHRNR